MGRRERGRDGVSLLLYCECCTFYYYFFFLIVIFLPAVTSSRPAGQQWARVLLLSWMTLTGKEQPAGRLFKRLDSRTLAMRLQRLPLPDYLPSTSTQRLLLSQGTRLCTQGTLVLEMKQRAVNLNFSSAYIFSFAARVTFSAQSEFTRLVHTHS